MMESSTSEKVIIAGCTVLAILSTLDGVLTLWGLSFGAIEEVNPVMRWLIGESPIVFMPYKLLFPVILGFIFWRIRNRSRKFVAYSLGLVLGVYSVVMVMHAIGLWFMNKKYVHATHQ